MSQTLRIALAFPACHRRGGVERILFECAHFLAAREHDTTVFAHEWDTTAPSSANLHYEAVAARAQPGFLYGRSFFEQCTLRMAQLKNSGAGFDTYGAFGCIAPTGGVPWVQSVHAAWLETSREFRAPLSWARWRQKLNPLHPVLLKLEKHHFAERRYRKVIALTPVVQADLQRIYDVPARDIVVLPNGFAPREFSLQRVAAEREPQRAALGLDEEDKVLIFVANEAERKGLETLLRAMAQLRDGRLKLLAAGRFDSAPWQALAEKLGIGAQVKWLGASGDVGALYAAADVFVLPTQYEPWGLVIVEAMACGLPALTSRSAGAAVAVRDGQTGALLDDPASVAETARRLEPLLEGRHAAREVIADSVQSYAWPHILERYEAVLREAAN